MPRSSSSLFVPSWFLRKLTWMQVISMVLHGGIAAKTTSVLLTKHLWTVSCLRHRAPSTVGIWFHSGQWGRRLRISQTTWFSAILESEWAWCILHPTENTWLETEWSKLPSPNVASFWFCWSEQHAVHAKCVRATHSLKEQPAECAYGNPKRRISEIMSGHSLSS